MSTPNVQPHPHRLRRPLGVEEVADILNKAARPLEIQGKMGCSSLRTTYGADLESSSLTRFLVCLVRRWLWRVGYRVG